MRFSVRHETGYRYSAPVRLATHHLRLTPRPAGLLASHHTLTVDPAPIARSDTVDRWGNPLTRIDFDGQTDHLVVVSRFEVETAPQPALVDGGWPRLPWPADGGLHPDHLRLEPDPRVRDYAGDLASASGWDALAFLDRLDRDLFTRTDRHIRMDGAAQAPGVTLETARGACRDITVLFMAAARSLGLAARFVSGYQAQAESVDGRRHLHAWPEVFLPGLGWRGFDPTHGIPVGDGHVALCAAPDQAETMPLEGGFWGDGVTSTLTYAVEIETAG